MGATGDGEPHMILEPETDVIRVELQEDWNDRGERREERRLQGADQGWRGLRLVLV